MRSSLKRAVCCSDCNSSSQTAFPRHVRADTSSWYSHCVFLYNRPPTTEERETKSDIRNQSGRILSMEDVSKLATPKMMVSWLTLTARALCFSCVLMSGLFAFANECVVLFVHWE